MNIKEKILTIISIIFLILLILSNISSCSKTKTLQKDLDLLSKQYYNSKMEFSVKRQKDSSIIVEQKQLLVNKEAQIIREIEKQEKLKNLKAQIKTKIEVRVDSFFIPYKDSVHIVKLEDSSDCLKLPAEVQHIDSNIQFIGNVTTEGLTIEHMKLIDSSSITIADKSKNLFSSEPIVKQYHSNPYIYTVDTKNIIVKQDKNKPLKTFFIGAGVGIGIETILLGLYYGLTHK